MFHDGVRNNHVLVLAFKLNIRKQPKT